MYSLKHLASFPGNLKDRRTVKTLNKINRSEGLVPHPLLFSLSQDAIIVSDEVTKNVLETYRVKKVLKCKCIDAGKDLGNVMLFSTSKAKKKARVAHVFKGSDELVSCLL